MSIRRAALLAMLLTAVTAILSSAVPALADLGIPPSPPNQAQALASAPAGVPSGSSTSSVDGRTALDASASSTW